MMTTFLLLLNGVLMLALPIALAVWIARRWQTGWRLFFIGAATFIGAQLLHIPFNWLILQRLALLPTEPATPVQLAALAIFLGASACLFEEGGRYLTYRFWAANARSWRQGMMVGAGHGGVEAVLAGVSALATFGLFLAVRQGALDANTLATAGPPEMLQAQIDTMFSLPWYMILLGAVERVFALALHLSLSLLVLEAVLRANRLWLVAAMMWHALANATAVFALETWGALASEVLLGLFALASIGIIFRLRTLMAQLETVGHNAQLAET